MEKIVKEGIKIDLHIHSCFSATKDKDKVKEGTKENLPILIAALNENEVNVCAITDHDNFNYELYMELKRQEGVGSIKKVLPGIEFSVLFSNGVEEKDVHIVTIFDDKDDEKIRKLEELIEDSKKGKGFNKERKAYTEDGYVAFLRASSVDVVTIAHQKNSITSRQGKQKTNVMALGKEKFDELLFIDYFDSYEFRNKQNEIFNKDYIWKNKLADKLHFVTGSDCHKWSEYTEEAKLFNFTYIKALPTFKGLAMAMTGPERIKYENNSFFNPNAKYYNEIKLDINGEEVTIPLSRGLNAIIGDNSVGKSLFLHALTNYSKMPNTKGLKNGYNKYLDENRLEIITEIAQDDIFIFNIQGEIRKIFDEGLSTSDFLKKFYPPEINAEHHKRIVETELERFYAAIHAKFEFDKMENKLQNFVIPSKGDLPKSLSFTAEVEKENVTGLRNLCIKLQNILDDVKDILQNEVLEKNDKIFIEGYEETLKILLKKYNDKLTFREKENSRINIYNTFMNRYESDYKQRTSDEHKIYSEFLQSKESAINEISTLVKARTTREKFEFDIEACSVVPERNLVGEYAFVSKIGVEHVDNTYLKGLCEKVLKKGKEIDTSTITENELRESISRYPDDVEKPLDALKIKIDKIVEDDFSVRLAVNMADKDVFKELSTGMNSQIYFTLLSSDKRDKGIYIIDQPEDHISQKSIRENVLGQFREMGRSRQVIFVTHNPQFIVNLDVDNVIFLSNEDGKFKVQSGALEYEDDEYKILKIIADNIDGGLDTIKGRLKRYAKDDGIEL